MEQVSSLPTKESVKVLTQTILPFSLHEINPRTIMGEKEWKKIKKDTQTKANHHCQCCGRYVKHISGDWLETHEMYNVDLEAHEFELTGFVGLCKDCHNYIHVGTQKKLRKTSLQKSKAVFLYGRKDFGISPHLFFTKVGFAYF